MANNATATPQKNRAQVNEPRLCGQWHGSSSTSPPSPPFARGAKEEGPLVRKYFATGSPPSLSARCNDDDKTLQTAAAAAIRRLGRWSKIERLLLSWFSETAVGQETRGCCCCCHRYDAAAAAVAKMIFGGNTRLTTCTVYTHILQSSSSTNNFATGTKMKASFSARPDDGREPLLRTRQQRNNNTGKRGSRTFVCLIPAAGCRGAGFGGKKNKPRSQGRGGGGNELCVCIWRPLPPSLSLSLSLSLHTLSCVCCVAASKHGVMARGGVKGGGEVIRA